MVAETPFFQGFTSEAQKLAAIQSIAAKQAADQETWIKAEQAGLPAGAPLYQAEIMAGGGSLEDVQFETTKRRQKAMTNGDVDVVSALEGQMEEMSGGLPPWLVGLIGAAGVALPVLGAMRVKMPWQTPHGEGFIAPWTAQEEVAPNVWGKAGMEYSPTALGLNGNGSAAAALGGGGLLAGGRRVVNSWTVGGRPFVMTDDGAGRHKTISTIKNDGSIATWRPYKSIVIGKNLTSSNVRRVSRRIKSHAKSLKKVLSILK